MLMCCICVAFMYRSTSRVHCCLDLQCLTNLLFPHHCSSSQAARPITATQMLTNIAFTRAAWGNEWVLLHCRCASVCIVREDAVTNSRPPFVTYETTVSKKAFEGFSQKYITHSNVASTCSMSHAASARDLASMGQIPAIISSCNATQQAPSEPPITDENQHT